MLWDFILQIWFPPSPQNITSRLIQQHCSRRIEQFCIHLWPFKLGMNICPSLAFQYNTIENVSFSDWKKCQIRVYNKDSELLFQCYTEITLTFPSLIKRKIRIRGELILIWFQCRWFHKITSVTAAVKLYILRSVFIKTLSCWRRKLFEILSNVTVLV